MVDKRLWLLAALLMIASTARGLNQEGVPGDRLVVSINNLPHTQRQAEAYITVKETFRQGPDGKPQPPLLIDADNWRIALDVYVEDMIVMQEAVRLGSFQPTEAMLDKYLAVVKERAASEPRLAAEFARLGLDDQSLRRTLDTVLRVAAFRKSKERQAAIQGKPEGARDKKRWLEELEDRAVVRFYKNADRYVRIEPVPGARAHGG